jgi:hypothetical protein
MAKTQRRKAGGVHLRGTLAGDGTYTRGWANELHPAERGFRAVAQKIAAAIQRLND